MLDEASLVQRLAAEFIGTAFLVFIGVGSVPATLILNGDEPFTMADLGMISFAFALVVIATVYALGHIGGNHINPAVTLGLAVSGKFPWRQVGPYIAAQVGGAVLGAAAIIAVLGMQASEVGLGVAAYADISVGQAFAAEFIGTFILVFTVFGVIHRKAAAGFAGLAIGFAVFAVIIVVAPATAAAINPARVVGPMLIQQIAGGEVLWGQLPVYVIAELLAGVVAALLYGVLSRTPADAGTADPSVDLAAPQSAVTDTSSSESVASSSESVSNSTGSREGQS
ncbi:MAG: aquaporin family protein [Actinomycetota bacterium]|nr:aquaporin family protein [Actinomycetota bacterium]